MRVMINGCVYEMVKATRSTMSTYDENHVEILQPCLDLYDSNNKLHEVPMSRNDIEFALNELLNTGRLMFDLRNR